MLHDPLPDAEFILDRFREIKKKLHLIYKKKKYFVEGDLEKYFKNKEIIWTPPSYEVKKIKKNEKITMKNSDKFNWQYKKNLKHDTIYFLCFLSHIYHFICFLFVVFS